MFKIWKLALVGNAGNRMRPCRRRSTGMDQITLKTPGPKCRLYWCLKEFIDCEESQSGWYFRPLLWTSAPLTFSLVHLPLLPPPCVTKFRGMSLYSVQQGGGIGLCREHLQELLYKLCIWPDSEPTKLLYHPKQKPRRGGGLRQINTCRQGHLQVNF
jgi:hypothetical protein